MASPWSEGGRPSGQSSYPCIIQYKINLNYSILMPSVRSYIPSFLAEAVESLRRMNVLQVRERVGRDC